MPPEGPARKPPDKLSLVVFSGAFDRVHYALVMASAAVATGTPATLFFTMEACRALAKPDKEGAPGWSSMPAGDRGGDAAAMDADLGARGVAQFEELLSACAEIGVRILVCEMGLRAVGMTRADLRDDIPIEETGVVTFLGDASGTGVVLFI